VPEQHRNSTVRSVIVHGTKNEAEGYVHWRLYFQLNQGSIEFNSQRRIADGTTTLYAIILSFIMFCLYSLQHQCPTKPKDMGEPHDASVMDDSIVQDRCSRKMHQRLAVNGGKSMV
jgi:hypothetical protein